MDRENIRHFDMVLVICVALVFIIGLAFLYSASSSLRGGLSNFLVVRQVSLLFIGLVVGIVILLIDYRRLIDAAFPLYILNMLILVLVLFMGSKRLGAQRWISVFGVAFQPSEFIKVSFILAFAAFLGNRADRMEGSDNILVPILFFMPPFILIAIQPDLGTALVLLPVMIAMIFIVGVRFRAIFLFLFFGALSTPIFWNFLKDYQKKRLLVFVKPNLDPLGAGYTIIQSKIAIGSGQIFGKGWLSGTQAHLNFLPERHTDFIFSVVGEEWGFVGCVILILIYFVMMFRGIRIIEETKDIYGKLIAAGIVSYLSFQVFVNIGMTLGLLPVVGLTLPFISYGGSSLISSIIAVCILLNVGMRRPLF